MGPLDVLRHSQPLMDWKDKPARFLVAMPTRFNVGLTPDDKSR